MDTFVLVFKTPTPLNWNFSINLEFCQYLTQNWVYIHQTLDKDVTWHAKFIRMMSSSLQGILIVEIQYGGHFVNETEISHLPTFSLKQNWILIHQTMDKDVTLHAEFGPMIRFSLQGILTVKIQDGGHFCR